MSVQAWPVPSLSSSSFHPQILVHSHPLHCNLYVEHLTRLIYPADSYAATKERMESLSGYHVTL